MAAVIAAALGCGCTNKAVAPVVAPSQRPLESISSHPSPQSVRQDLIATSRERYGAAAVERALTAPTYLIVKRFAGMVPPPPPGAGQNWRPPTPGALLIRDEGQWLAATSSGWRRADPTAAGDLDTLLADQRFWSEPSYIPPCPDFGASLLLLKVPGRAEVLRTSTCSSLGASAVEAALRG